MTYLSEPSASPTVGAAASGYRTLWRWHFYAGLFVMPFLIVLAVTGTLYCFQPQIEPLLYPQLLTVEPEVATRLSPDALLERAREIAPKGAVPTSVRVAAASDRSAEYVFRYPDGHKESVYLDPYSGAGLGTLSVEGRLMQIDRMVHRKLLLGKPGELLMELVACWTLVMIGTGVALWWPGAGMRMRDVLLPRLTLRGRPFWKSLHAVLGIWLALGALTFVATGLPWTGSWGKQFKSIATRVNLGSPPGSWGGLSVRSTIPGEASASHISSHAAAAVHPTHAAHDMDSMPGMVMDDLPLTTVPWAVGAVPLGHSQEKAGATQWPLARVIDSVRALGVEGDFEIALPIKADGVYAVSYFPSDPKLERTVYIDQYSGAILKDIRYADYGAVSKAVSYGTSLHMGRYLGLANQLVCTAISLGLTAMAITGLVMWWQRRPAGSLGAPRRMLAAPPMRGWKIGLMALGAIFPLMGITLVGVWIADRLAFGGARRHRRVA